MKVSTLLGGTKGSRTESFLFTSCFGCTVIDGQDHVRIAGSSFVFGSKILTGYHSETTTISGLINAIATLINKVLPVTDTWALRNSAVRPPADTEVVDVILSRKEEDLLRNMVLGRPEGRPNEDVLCLTKVKCRIPGKRIFSVLVAFEQRQGEGGSNGTHGG